MIFLGGKPTLRNAYLLARGEKHGMLPTFQDIAVISCAFSLAKRALVVQRRSFSVENSVYAVKAGPLLLFQHERENNCLSILLTN